MAQLQLKVQYVEFLLKVLKKKHQQGVDRGAEWKYSKSFKYKFF